MPDAARIVNPNPYVCVELFTGSEEMDLLFIKRLGIDILIRECYDGWEAKEYSSLLYRHGVGEPWENLSEVSIDGEAVQYGSDACSIGSMDGETFYVNDSFTIHHLSPVSKGTRSYMA